MLNGRMFVGERGVGLKPVRGESALSPSNVDLPDLPRQRDRVVIDHAGPPDNTGNIGQQGGQLLDALNNCQLLGDAEDCKKIATTASHAASPSNGDLESRVVRRIVRRLCART